MPYEIRYRPGLPPKDRPWKIWNKDKKKYVGSSISEEMARRAIIARSINEHRQWRI